MTAGARLQFPSCLTGTITSCLTGSETMLRRLLFRLHSGHFEVFGIPGLRWAPRDGENELPSARSFYGFVYAPDRSPATQGTVEVWRHDFPDFPITTVPIQSDGSFKTGPIPEVTGGFKFRVVGVPGAASVWFENSFDKYTEKFQDASIVTFQSRTSREALSEGLLTGPPPAAINGELIVPSHFASDNACVVLYEAYQPSRLSARLGEICGAPGSSFSFSGSTAGDYSLCLVDAPGPGAACSGTSAPWDHFGGDTLDQAIAITVAEGETKDVTIDFGGTIQATALDVSGESITGGCVEAYDSVSGELEGSDCVGTGGTYSVPVGFETFGGHTDKVKLVGFSGYRDQW